MASKTIDVLGSKMYFHESGAGDPILFLHGIPTSSYLWRNVIPHLEPLGRCIAPDLIGLGKSDKPDIEYSVFDHLNYIEQFIEKLALRNITFVMHGWGSVIGFAYAMRNEQHCKGLVFYEAFLQSQRGDDISLPFQEQLLTLHDQEATYDFAHDGTIFVDKIIPQNVMRRMTDAEMAHYREPFTKQNSGKPIVQYLKEIPKGDGIGKVSQLIADYSKNLSRSQLPKLMLYSVPGFITTIATVMWAKANLPNIEVVDIGEELHLAQESCPDMMGESISIWLQAVEQIKV